jgi:hypothetical protein
MIVRRAITLGADLAQAQATWARLKVYLTDKEYLDIMETSLKQWETTEEIQIDQSTFKRCFVHHLRKRYGPTVLFHPSWKEDDLEGEFHDQGDAKWIVIKGQLRGHNDTPFGRPTYRPPGVGCPQGVIGGF